MPLEKADAKILFFDSSIACNNIPPLSPAGERLRSEIVRLDGNEQCLGTVEVEPPAGHHLEDEGDLSSARKRICRWGTLESFTLGTAAQTPDCLFFLKSLWCVCRNHHLHLFIPLWCSMNCYWGLLLRACFDNDYKYNSPSRTQQQRICICKIYTEHNLRVLHRNSMPCLCTMQDS